MASVVHLNLAVLRKSRHQPAVGDIFAMLPPDGSFLFGRVVGVGMNAGGFPNANLIYVYRARSRDGLQVPRLSPHELLVPPQFINNLGWSRGYFEHIKNAPMGPEDRLPVHCFRDSIHYNFVDENGRVLPEAVEPVGSWGLGNHRTLDDAISYALGIPPAP